MTILFLVCNLRPNYNKGLNEFNDLNLSDPILRSLKDQNYKEPTPIQAEVIPAILNKSDIMAAAQTGTGKTAAFVLPILSILSNPKNTIKVIN